MIFLYVIHEKFIYDFQFIAFNIFDLFIFYFTRKKKFDKQLYEAYPPIGRVVKLVHYIVV